MLAIGCCARSTWPIQVLLSTAPVVVHCSAGIGRTGTWILIDLAMTSLERSRSVDLLEVLDTMRQQRMGQVGPSIHPRFPLFPFSVVLFPRSRNEDAWADLRCA